jgi:hypothetical protein
MLGGIAPGAQLFQAARDAFMPARVESAGH